MEQSLILRYVLVGLLGLAIGSFLNVVVYRWPREKKFWVGRSVCPSCDNKLKWYHNIPLLSYVFLRGKCGFCGEKISWRYPLVEALNAGAYLYFFWQFQWSIEFGIFAFLSSALIAIFFIDLDFQLIPDIITLPGMVIGVAVSFLPGGLTWSQSLIGLVVGGGALFVVAELGERMFKKPAMGGGDIKMAAMIGAFLGWQKVLLVFISSAVFGLVISIVLMIFSAKLRENRVVPFGPFIAMAAMTAILWGDRIIHFYVSNFL
ncbi:prepilin peptidase [candidate division GN15 bacterium]|nr:prepilin peptidase [candidate division GN15 bacterium]